MLRQVGTLEKAAGRAPGCRSRCGLGLETQERTAQSPTRSAAVPTARFRGWPSAAMVSTRIPPAEPAAHVTHSGARSTALGCRQSRPAAAAPPGRRLSVTGFWSGENCPRGGLRRGGSCHQAVQEHRPALSRALPHPPLLLKACSAWPACRMMRCWMTS